MLKKTISSLTTLLAALLLVSCAPSHSTNNQPTASSTEVTQEKRNFDYSKCNARRSRSAIENLESSRREQSYESAQSQLQD